MGETKAELSPNAQKILDKFRETAARNHAVWSKGDISYRLGMTTYRLEKILPELVDGGHLVTVREERIEKDSLLFGVYGARSKGTYYMLPEALEELKENRKARIQEPYYKQARENILKKYAEEVQAEFNRLWENRSSVENSPIFTAEGTLARRITSDQSNLEEQ